MRRFKIFPFILIAVLVKAGLFMLLWNALIPDLFHGPLLEYPQALGLLILTKILVGFGGGFGHHHHHRGRFGRHGFGKGHWCKMSSEERQKLREEMRKRWEK